MKYIHSLFIIGLMGLNLQAEVDFSLKKFSHEHPEMAFILGAAAVASGAACSWYLYKKAEWWWIQRKPANILYSDALNLYEELNVSLGDELMLVRGLKGASEADELVANMLIENFVVNRYADVGYPVLGFVLLLRDKMQVLDGQKKILEGKLAQGDPDTIELEADIEALIGNISNLRQDLAALHDILKDTYRYKYEEASMQPPRVVYIPSSTPGFHSVPVFH